MPFKASHKFGLCLLLLSHILLLSSQSGLAQITNGEHSPNPLYVDPANHDFTPNPDLLTRIRNGVHGYFRFINIEFSTEVCSRFESIIAQTPSFNLHGDAHIEQYAVTSLGRGLTDFDDSSTGPAFLDILRFGVSLDLACRQLGWHEHSEDAFQEFLNGYHQALRDPEEKSREPRIVKRIRGKFRYNRKSYFHWIQSIIDPMPETEHEELKAAMAPYIGTMLADRPELGQAYFEIVQMGYLRLGIGSALDQKYLIRIRGESDDPEDDVILEIKEVRDISGIPCIDRPMKSDPYRVLLGHARIAYQPFKLLGYIRLKGDAFWIHAWVDNYREVKIDRTFQSPDEIKEVAFDTGVQLGRGHPKQIASPLDAQLRREQLRLLSKYDEQLRRTRRELAELTVKAWEKFCAEAANSNAK